MNCERFGREFLWVFSNLVTYTLCSKINKIIFCLTNLTDIGLRNKIVFLKLFLISQKKMNRHIALPKVNTY